jgi:hypothetical protein
VVLWDNLAFKPRLQGNRFGIVSKPTMPGCKWVFAALPFLMYSHVHCGTVLATTPFSLQPSDFDNNAEGIAMDFVPHFYMHGRMAVVLVAALMTLWLRIPAFKLMKV